MSIRSTTQRRHGKRNWAEQSVLSFLPMVKKLKLTRAYFALLIALLVLTAAGYAGLIETAIGGPIINPGFTVAGT